MGTRVTTPFPGGLGILDKCIADNLAANTATATTSDYTEATPRPGVAVAGEAFSNMRVEVSNAQQVDLVVTCVKAGNPGRELAGAQLAYRKDSEAVGSTRGWDSPGVTRSWFAVEGNNANNLFRNDIAVQPKSQTASIIYREPASSDAVYSTLTATGTLVEAANTIADGTDWNYPALLVLPESERVIAFYGGTAYYTDDDAATAWIIHSTRIVDSSITTSTFQETRVAQYKSSIIMLCEDSTTNKVTHLASDDGGATFTVIGEHTGFGSKFTVAAGTDALYVCYIDQSTNVQVRALQSASDALDAADPVQVVASCDEAGIAVDAGGTVYVFTATTAVPTTTQVQSSDDLGLTWSSAWTGQPFVSAAGTGPVMERIVLAWAAGRCLLLSYLSGAAGTTTLGVWACGGWNNAPIISQDTTTGQMSDRYGFSNTWVPADLPTLFGYTLTGTAIALSGGEGRWNLAAASGFYTIGLSTNTCAVAEFEMLCAVGGSLSLQECGMRMRVADGVFDYEMRFQALTTGYRFIDFNGPVTTDIVTTMTAYQEFAVYIDEGEARVWRRTRGGTIWTLDIDTTLTNDAATPQAGGTLVWGTEASSTVDHSWRTMRVTAGADTIDISQAVAEHFGRPMNAQGFPIPEVGTAALSARMGLVSGPCRRNDTNTVVSFKEHAVENLLADLSPSPGKKWRSTSTAEQRFVWELGDTTLGLGQQIDYHGFAMMLYVENLTSRTAEVSVYNGATYDALETLDTAADFIDVHFTRKGRVLVPAVGTNGLRYLWENELAGGGWVRLDGAANQVARTIAANTAGGWQADATDTPIPTITLNDIDGTEPTSGTMRIHCPKAVMVIYLTAAQVELAYSSHIQIVLPAGTAGEDAPATFYEAGIVMPMRLQPHGMRINDGDAREQVTHIRSTRDEAGTSHIRELGAPRRDWQFGWAASGPDMSDIRTNINPNYIGVSGGLPLVAEFDVHQMLMGIVDVTRSGQVPVVVVEDLPETTGTTLTDPTRFLYGRLVSPIRVENVLGTRGVDEKERVAVVTVEGIS